MKGEALTELRKAWGLKQEELAGVLGVHSLTVSAWERGKQAIPEPVALLLAALQTIIGSIQQVQARKAAKK